MTLPSHELEFEIRAAAGTDVDAIAEVWHRAWSDGHRGHVPEALLPFRELEHFRERVPARIARTTVAALDSRVVGFVTVHDDEVEQVFVVASARGRGIADALLRHAETAIARDFDTAWLAVVEGNARARRFYDRQGWRDAGPLEYAAEIPGGTLPVPTRRYEKRLGGS
jgi:ribosomal protein S18 acetylase RimI-like enzyme